MEIDDTAVIGQIRLTLTTRSGSEPTGIEAETARLIECSRNAYDTLFGPAILLIPGLVWLYMPVFSMANMWDNLTRVFHHDSDVVWVLAVQLLALFPLICQAAVVFLTYLELRADRSGDDIPRLRGFLRALARTAVCLGFGVFAVPSLGWTPGFIPIDTNFTVAIHQSVGLVLIFGVHVVLATAWSLYRVQHFWRR